MPLKMLPDFVDDEGTINFYAFGLHAEKIARKKIKALEKGLAYIDYVGQQIALQEKYPSNIVYRRTFEEQYFYVVPCESNFEDMSRYEPHNLIESYQVLLDDLDLEESSWLESGIMLEKSDGQISRYIFAEVAKDKANFKLIPSGTYVCMQCEGYGSIEQTAEIFSAFLTPKSAFLASETMIFSEKVNLNNPICELCCIVNTL